MGRPLAKKNLLDQGSDSEEIGGDDDAVLLARQLGMYVPSNESDAMDESDEDEDEDDEFDEGDEEDEEDEDDLDDESVEDEEEDDESVEDEEGEEDGGEGRRWRRTPPTHDPLAFLSVDATPAVAVVPSVTPPSRRSQRRRQPRGTRSREEADEVDRLVDALQFSDDDDDAADVVANAPAQATGRPSGEELYNKLMDDFARAEQRRRRNPNDLEPVQSAIRRVRAHAPPCPAPNACAPLTLGGLGPRSRRCWDRPSRRRAAADRRGRRRGMLRTATRTTTTTTTSTRGFPLPPTATWAHGGFNSSRSRSAALKTTTMRTRATRTTLCR